MAAKRRRRKRQLLERPVTLRFAGPYYGMAVNTINRNIWRMHNLVTRDDLLQDAAELFLIVQRRYRPTSRRWFMALFQRTLNNHLHRVAFECSRFRNVHVSMEDVPQVSQPDGVVGLLWHKAPREVLEVLRVVVNAPTEIASVICAAFHSDTRAGRRKGNELLKKLLPRGLDVSGDLLGDVKRYFQP